MAKSSNNFLTLLSLIIIFNLFICIVSIEINYDNESERTIDETKSASYIIKLGKEIPNYIKVIITPHNNYPTPLLCYSQSYSNCDKDRIVYDDRQDKKPSIAFIKKEDIKENEFYITVTCKNENKCDYNLELKGNDICKIEDGTIYSYIVTESTEEMTFEFYGESIFFTIMNIGVEGSTSAYISLDDTFDLVEPYYSVYEKAKFISFPLEKETQGIDRIVSFKISNAKVGEYIRLSAYTYRDGNVQDNLLYPGGPTVSGVLYKHELSYPQICFPVSAMTNEFGDISKFYLTGIMYSKYGLYWLLNEESDYMEDTEIEISDGLISVIVEPSGKKTSICFEFYGSYFEQTIKQSDVAFSIALVPAPYKKTGNFYQINPPQIIGLTQPYILPKDKSLLYHGTMIEAGRYSFFLYNRKGITKMYVTDCDDYNNCNYDMSDDTVLEKMEEVENSGKYIFYDSSTETGWNALAKNKRVIIVTCIDEGNDSKGICEFDLSIYNKNNSITLVEGQNLAQYVPQGQTGNFRILYNGALELLSVAVEIMIHSGETTFRGDFSPEDFDLLTDDDQYSSAKTYILSNKVLIYFDLKRYAYDALYVKYKAIKNTFFTIKYHEWRADAKDEFLNEIIFPGESYLLAINPDSKNKYTVARVENNRYKTKNYFTTNFFALNCDFKVLVNKTKGETEIAFADGYAQDTLGEEEGNYYSKDYYDYKISIEEEEKSNYNNKMCMIYVAGYLTSDLSFTTSILTGSNVNQQIIFDKEKFRAIRFLYEHTDYDKSLIVYANIIDKAYYTIQISINDENNIYQRQVITRSYPYYISKSDLQTKCKNTKSFCNIYILIELSAETPGMSVTDPMVEITVREATPKGETELLRVPSYLQKNSAKIDFTTGDGYYYLYTDIGKGDEGEVTVNFLRDFGEVYGRIVKKNEKDNVPDKDIEWMDLYRLPSEAWEEDGAKFNGYLKKYIFSQEDTENCFEGCYLILGIRISQVGEWAEDYKFYPFSIIALIGPKFYYSNDASKVTIQIDEFIIGNVDVSSNTRISQFYEVWITRDANQISIDWQSELAGLYINIDGTKPTTKNADFILLPNGKDNIFTIPKYQFIDKAKEKKMDLPYQSSLEDLNLVIGIWTDKTDSADTELYSLRIRETGFHTGGTGNEVDVIDVNTDQKIMCKPVQVNDVYRCLFMITYDDQDVDQNMDLLVYTASTDLGATNEVYANFVYARLFNEYNITELEKNAPSKGKCEFDSTRDDFTYLYIKLKDRHKYQYLYVNILTNSSDDIMMIASINSYDIENGFQQYNANARTEQIVQVKEPRMQVIFPIEANLIVNIEDLGGEADIHWSNDNSAVYNLRGKGDRVTLTTSSSYKNLTITKVASDKNNTQGKEPGFVFIINYYTRNIKVNFDEVTYGNSIEIGYRDTDLPVFLYSKISDYSSDINLAVTFADSHIDTEGEYDGSPIIIKGALDTRNKIYTSKTNPEFVPSNSHTIIGHYDPAIKTGQVFFQNSTIQQFNIAKEDFPTLLLYLKKEKKYKNKKYEKFNIESQFTRTNSLVVPTQKVYNYGKCNGVVTQYYRLKVDKNKKIMKIVLSFNSNLLSWAISAEPSSRQNDTNINIKSEEARGKITITLDSLESDFIYLNIFKADNTLENKPHLQNYAFKYINVEDESKYFDYTIVNNDGTLDYKEETVDGKARISCTFNKIDLIEGQANITYFLKIVDSKLYQGENIKTVALSESTYYTKYKRNPTADNNSKITLSAIGDFSDWIYMQIIAQIQQNKVIDYVAYDGVKNDKNK